MVCGAVSCKKDKPSKKIPEGAVDLGIVMTRADGTTYNLYWAKSNLCETGLCANPEDYGDYYAWGETKPKSEFNWSTYKYGSSSSGPFTKYNGSDKTVLDPDDDAVVQAILGGKWRMPTIEEWMALREQSTWVWTDDYNGTGIKGRIITANNGNSIFLPATGYRYNAFLDDDGAKGFYWSSSLNTDEPNKAWYIFYDSVGPGRYSEDRIFGQAIRPVYEK